MSDWTETERRRLERVLGHEFRDPDLLRAALTHRSHSYEQAGDDVEDYERLEFLGDSLLGFVVAEWLYRDDPGCHEGVLTWRRANVVREATLARVSRSLGLGDSIRLGRGEAASGGQLKRALLADLFEAVLGAVFLDAGYRAGKRFVLRHLGPELRRVRERQDVAEDYKSRLQVRFQGLLQRTPRYRIVSKSGPAHALEFEVEVLVDDEVLARGTGSSRKQAEQNAAHAAFERLEKG